jgi:hypothetical protein
LQQLHYKARGKKKYLFVFILLDKMSDITNIYQLSTGICYVCDTGQVQERFLSFVDISCDTTADVLHKHVVWVAQDYNFECKIASQTYSGASIMTGNFGGLMVKVREK